MAPAVSRRFLMAPPQSFFSLTSTNSFSLINDLRSGRKSWISCCSVEVSVQKSSPP